MKTGKYSFERGIIALHYVEKYASLPLPIWRKRGGLVVQVSFQSVAHFTIVRQMAPLPSGLNAAMENASSQPPSYRRDFTGWPMGLSSATVQKIQTTTQHKHDNNNNATLFH